MSCSVAVIIPEMVCTDGGLRCCSKGAAPATSAGHPADARATVVTPAEAAQDASAAFNGTDNAQYSASRPPPSGYNRSGSGSGGRKLSFKDSLKRTFSGRGRKNASTDEFGSMDAHQSARPEYNGRNRQASGQSVTFASQPDIVIPVTSPDSIDGGQVPYYTPPTMALPPIPSDPKSSKKAGGRVNELAVPAKSEGTYGRSASMDVNRTPGGNASTGNVRSGYSSETDLGDSNVGRYGPGVGGGKPIGSQGTINRLRKMSLPKPRPKMSIGTGNGGSSNGGGGFWQKREYVISLPVLSRIFLLSLRCSIPVSR